MTVAATLVGLHPDMIVGPLALSAAITTDAPHIELDSGPGTLESAIGALALFLIAAAISFGVGALLNRVGRLPLWLRVMLAGLLPLALMVAFLVFAPVILGVSSLSDSVQMFRPLPLRAQFFFAVILSGGVISAFWCCRRFDARVKAEHVIDTETFE